MAPARDTSFPTGNLRGRGDRLRRVFALILPIILWVGGTKALAGDEFRPISLQQLFGPSVEASRNMVSGGRSRLTPDDLIDDLSGSIETAEERASASRAPSGRWFLTEYDFDNRGFNVFHVMGHSPLPYNFSIWGFIDIEGFDQTGADREELGTYFLEVDLKKRLTNSAGLIAELNDLHGPNNTIGRFGAYWAPPIPFLSPETGLLKGKGKLAFKVFPIESDGKGSQFSFNWNKQFDAFFDGRFSAGGFFDLNFDAGRGQNHTIIVTEHQLRYRILEGLHVITEFRINEFLRDDYGIAPGLQYRY